MTWRPLPRPADGPQPRRLGGSLDRLTRGLGAPGAAPMAALFDRWADIAGPTVAAHTRPISLRAGLLTIAVDDPAWGTQLTYLEADLCRRVEEVTGAGAVRKVAIRVRPR